MVNFIESQHRNMVRTIDIWQGVGMHSNIESNHFLKVNFLSFQALKSHWSL